MIRLKYEYISYSCQPCVRTHNLKLVKDLKLSMCMSAHGMVTRAEVGVETLVVPCHGRSHPAIACHRHCRHLELPQTSPLTVIVIVVASLEL